MDGRATSSPEVLTMGKRHRHIDPAKARDAAGGGIGGWYDSIPVETPWRECSACGIPSRILDAKYEECIKCQVERARRARVDFSILPVDPA
ncbi:MAG: hypothetical protein ACYC24_08765 [Desulfobacteria bacterium]